MSQPTDEQQTDVRGREFLAPYSVTDSALTEPERYIARVPFELEEQQFDLLRSAPAGSIIIGGLAGAAVAFVLTVAAKELARRFLNKAGPEEWEYMAVFVSLGATAVVWLVSRFWKTKRSELVKLIREFYKANPGRRLHVNPLGKQE